VTQVEFFNDSASLDIDTTNPYGVPVNNLAAGTYTLSAVATDNLGAKATNSVRLTVNGPAQPATLFDPLRAGNDFMFSFASQSGRTYQVQYTDGLGGGSWQLLTTLTGNGSTMTVTNRNVPAALRFYRVESQ